MVSLARTPLASAPVFPVALAAAVALVACSGRLAGVVRTQASQDFGCPEAQIEVRDEGSGNAIRDFAVTGCGRQDHYQAACGMVGGCVAYRPGEAAKYPSAASDARMAGAEDLKAGDASEPVGGVTTMVVEAATPDEAGAGAGPVVAGEVIEATPGAPVGTAGEGAVTELSAALPGSQPGTATPDASPSPSPSPSPTVAARVSTEERTVTLRNACTRRVVFYIGKAPGEAGGRYMTLGSTNMISPRLRVGDQVWLLDAQQAALTSVSVANSTEEIEVSESCAGLTAR